MKNHYAKIISFIAVLILPMLAWFVIALFAPGKLRELDYDLGEKRDRTDIGSVTQLASSGDDVTSFFADRAPFRSVLIDFYQKLYNAAEVPYEKGIKPALVKLYPQGDSKERSTVAYEKAFEELFRETPKEKPVAAEKPETEEIAEPEPEPVEEVVEKKLPELLQETAEEGYFAPNTHGEGVIIGRNDWFFLDMTGDVEYFKGTNLLTEEEEAEYLSKIRKINQLCEDRGIKLAVLLAPDKEQVYSEYMPSYKVENEYKRLARFADHVKENSDVKISYPMAEIKYASRYWHTYYKYDTHWNGVGAFIGVQAIYQMIGMETVSPIDLEIEIGERTENGDLFELGEIDPESYPPDSEYAVHYKDDVQMVFESPEGINANVFRSAAECENDDKIVLVGDSFRIAMTDYLKKDFAECVIAHRDNTEEIADDMRETDYLVLETAERFDYLMFQSLDEVIEILSP